MTYPKINNNILSVHSINYSNDSIFWELTGDGKFSSKSCYKLISSDNKNSTDFSWIWDMRCPNEIKILLWKCLHNKLPTRSYLHHIGLNIDPTYPVCKDENEYRIHIFTNCKAVLNYWTLRGLNMSALYNDTHWL